MADKTTLFGHSPLHESGVSFCILSPRLSNGNFPDRTKAFQLRMFEGACRAVGVRYDCWASEDTHVAHVESQAQLDRLVGELTHRGAKLDADDLHKIMSGC